MADALERQDFEFEEVDAESVNCTGCGSNLVFHPESKSSCHGKIRFSQR
jgi:hypothetical protein